MASTLDRQIQQFYDASTPLWEKTWGEHLHHGYYGPHGRHRKQRQQAQIDLIDELLAWGEVSAPQQILDAGCGVGGSSRYLAQKYPAAQVVGITLSPVQARRATERTEAIQVSDGPDGSALHHRVGFQVANALETPFPDQQFDFIWSLESGEHFPNKVKFLQECQRLLKPGGQLLLATWCHRPTDSLAGPLTLAERHHLEAIYQNYALPYVISLPDYVEIAETCGFSQIRSADWSAAVAPFWDEVIASALNGEAIAALIQSGWTTIRGAFTLLLMRQGFASGLIRYGLLSAHR